MTRTVRRRRVQLDQAASRKCGIDDHDIHRARRDPWQDLDWGRAVQGSEYQVDRPPPGRTS